MAGLDTRVEKRQRATAKRVRHVTTEPLDHEPPDRVVMETVVCDQCGARFEIGHAMASQDPALATRQAAWLAEQLVWDHIQEGRHRGTQYLPTLHELK
jgi:hypothetical protein